MSEHASLNEGYLLEKQQHAGMTIGPTSLQWANHRDPYLLTRMLWSHCVNNIGCTKGTRGYGDDLVESVPFTFISYVNGTGMDL